VVLDAEIINHQDKVIGRVEWRKRPGVLLVWWKSKDWRRETRRRFDSLLASLRPYIAFSIRKSMYGFPALSCLRKGWRETRDKTSDEKMLVYIFMNWGVARGDRGRSR
jgi:hypothetical protein